LKEILMLKAILFDHDGTIVDSEHCHFEMWHEVLQNYSITLTFEEYRKHYTGIPTPRLSEVLTHKYALNIDPSVLLTAKMDATNQYLSTQAYPLMEGALEAIQFFHAQGLAIAVVTGSAKEGVNSTIKNHGLDKYVTATVSRDDVEKTKPAPDSYLLAAKRLGVEAKYCLAIEDTYNGSLAASQAGIQCIGVSPSAAMRDKFSTTVHVCSCLDEAKDWIIQTGQVKTTNL
jgi:HAD superfamily hydrolase (TIGR01509 family)